MSPMTIQPYRSMAGLSLGRKVKLAIVKVHANNCVRRVATQVQKYVDVVIRAVTRAMREEFESWIYERETNV